MTPCRSPCRRSPHRASRCRRRQALPQGPWPSRPVYSLRRSLPASDHPPVLLQSRISSSLYEPPQLELFSILTTTPDLGSTARSALPYGRASFSVYTTVEHPPDKEARP